MTSGSPSPSYTSGAHCLDATGATPSSSPDAVRILAGQQRQPRGPGAIDAVLVKQAPASGFDFGDALIGLAGDMGLALLITGSVILLASQRNKTRIA